MKLKRAKEEGASKEKRALELVKKVEKERDQL